MTDQLEELIRDAGDWPVAPLDTTAIANRARQRRRRRHGLAAVAAVVAVALILGVGAIVWPHDQDQPIVSTTGKAPNVTWTPLILPPGTGGVGRLAGGPEGMIAIGATGVQDKPTDPRPVPTIWSSTDGGITWSVSYTDPALVPADEKGNFKQRQASFGAAYYVNGMFVVTGTLDLGFGEPSIAGIWTSPDGNTWTRADSTAFRSPVTDNSSGSESRIYDVTEWQGQLVAVGDVFVDAPKKKQCCGVGVGVWTSPDGITWKQHIADLGSGFDPYITSLTTRGTKLVGGGSVDIRNGVVWTTTDLRTWDRSTIADDGRGQLFRAGTAYVTAGLRFTGPEPADKKHPVPPAKDTGIPTIWWSRDAQDWEAVFSLSEGSAKQTATSFTGGAGVPGLAVAIGPSVAGSTKIYASTHGRDWHRLASPAEGRNSRLTIAGTDADGIYVSQDPENASNTAAAPSTVWRVAPAHQSTSNDISWTCRDGITPPAVVPDFIGKEFSAAGQEACDLGLRVGRAKGSRGDIVYEQSPAAGTPIVTSPLYVDLKAH